MFNFSGNIENLLKLPLKIIVALCISSGLILFLPNNIIEKLYMVSFRNDFGFILGLIFVISLSIIVCSVIVSIIKVFTNKMKNKEITKTRNKLIESLDKNERNLLKTMYKEVDKTLDLPYESGMILKLISYNIIAPVSAENFVDPLDPRIPCFLQPWVCRYIEQHKDF